MRHAILGVGGVGGLIGASLAKTGDSVTLVVRSETLSSFPKQLQLESAFGTFSVPVELSSTVPEADVVWITVKATQLARALTSFSETVPVRAIVPLLNGIDHVSLLREKYGVDRVIPATIAVESERVSPGPHRSSLSVCAVKRCVAGPGRASGTGCASAAIRICLPVCGSGGDPALEQAGVSGAAGAGLHCYRQIHRRDGGGLEVVATNPGLRAGSRRGGTDGKGRS